ncbi:hypothetical protein COCSUDRAFT_32730 [Coccomyxa subellipsoidea C-169]|uniref:Uncharacterized protein n=1 Tax=Coccomyxa subellipsoidea (strain C-169) TaxID=574566 RepID=I0Z1F1_COCSC|nr:hypothetical protein COCSUDRAFT_32730 [Coccomyxa subellipsoidea C-169]EIE24470.1 hypothetical protein COCSUDRAFT_32730 [Coccomyxa subellipsoidea C-169]|eukprot:XP_005649014.1 hypothetical protein COCSUDRAFT_32730 [Coccomyxa subellipsoidea C-169]
MADLIGAEFRDPSAAPQQPMHEQLATTLTALGIHSKHGHEHFLNTVRHMVDAVSHITGPGAASAAGTTGQSAHMVGRDQLPQEGNPQADAQAGLQMGGRKDLGGADPVAHGGTVQQVPAAHLLEQAAATQGTPNVPPGHDHSGYPGWQQHDSNPATPGVHEVHADIHHAHQQLHKPAAQHHRPDAAGFIY